jgi:hypothetical protein
MTYDIVRDVTAYDIVGGKNPDAICVFKFAKLRLRETASLSAAVPVHRRHTSESGSGSLAPTCLQVGLSHRHRLTESGRRADYGTYNVLNWIAEDGESSAFQFTARKSSF